MYGKIENGVLVSAPAKLTIDGNNVWNAPESTYNALGWKYVEYINPPGDAPVGYYYDFAWEDLGAKITQNWFLVEVPEDEDITDKQALEIMLGGEEI